MGAWRISARAPVTQTEAVLWHNPRCSKSRRALELLHDAGYQVSVFEYLKAPPDRAAVQRLVNQLEIPARALVRTGDALFAELQFDENDASEESWCDLLAAHPRLIQRPVLVVGEHATIGRPPERILDLL